jgi:hypothetical protein
LRYLENVCREYRRASITREGIGITGQPNMMPAIISGVNGNQKGLEVANPKHERIL